MDSASAKGDSREKGEVGVLDAPLGGGGGAGDAHLGGGGGASPLPPPPARPPRQAPTPRGRRLHGGDATSAVTRGHCHSPDASS